MSRANEVERPPQTPRSKPSGSSLLAAFKGLTGGKSKQQSYANSPESYASNVAASASQDHLDSGPLDDSLVTSKYGESELLHDDLEDSSTIKVSSPQSSLPGAEGLILSLARENTLSKRIVAANSVTQLLGKYGGANVMSIWAVGQDLLQYDEDSDALHAGYGLLIACIRHKKLTSQERKYFFNSISKSDNLGEFALRFQVLRDITEDGRNVECLELDVMELLVGLLGNCYNAAALARKDSGRKKTFTGDEQDHLDMVFAYILGVIKHNAKVFSERDLTSLVNRVSWLCSKTTSAPDISKSIEVMDALITYSSLPLLSLRICLELLGGIYGGPKELKDQRLSSWKTIVNLLGSHLRPATISTLLTMLKELPTLPGFNSNILRGSILILREVIKSEDVENLPQASLSKVVSAARQAIDDADSVRLEMAVMELLLTLMSGPDPISILSDEKTWSNIVLILKQAYSRISKKDIKDSTKSEDDQEASYQQLLQSLADRLRALTTDGNSDQRNQVMRLLMHIIRSLNESTTCSLVIYVAEEYLLYPFNDGWQVDFDWLYNAIWCDFGRSTEVRKIALDALYDAYRNGEALGVKSIDDRVIRVIESIHDEPDLALFEHICSIGVSVGAWTSNESTFESIVKHFESVLTHLDKSSTPTSPAIGYRQASLPRAVTRDDNEPDSIGLLVSKALVMMFLRNINRSAWKSKRLYRVFLGLAGSHTTPADARIMALKVLFRLRADVNHAVFIVSSTHVESVAALLCRTSDTLSEYLIPEEVSQRRSGKADDQMARRSGQGSTGNMKGLTRSSSNVAKGSSSAGRINRPTPPLWLYPGPKGLPEEPPLSASHLVFSSNSLPPTASDPEQPIVLKINEWLELLIDILQQNELEWEVFSYILVHLGAQLTNHALFTDSVPQIKFLRGVICDQLSSKKFHEPPAITNLKKSDVAICMYHILTMLVSYHEHFSPNEESDTVKILALGIGSWERTSETCIHALSVCCHELPLSIVKSMENILHRLSQIITQSQLAVHVLEFLATLARLPDLYKNFREEDFKTVFGICFRFLQSVRDARFKVSDSSNMKSSNVISKSQNSTRYMSENSIFSPGSNTVADSLPQYVYALAYHVMTFWFMALRLEDRPKHVGWISKSLVYTDDEGKEVIEDQALVTIDMMHRISFSDHDETAPNDTFATEFDGVRSQQSWVVGTSIVTIETAGRTGVSQITRRRPSATRYSVYRPQLVPRQRHQVSVAPGPVAESYFTSSYIGIMPSDVLQEFYAPLNLNPSTLHGELPIPLPSDESTARAISSFDRISALDGHKVGILYVGEAQCDEVEILSNVMGSADYTYFLRNIGTLIELKNASFNTQGLDRELDTDGKYTFCWRDRVTEIVFHIPTMMPTSLERDPRCTLKKRHIGNDFVNIIFNNSGVIYDMNTIPSEFNYVNIVITPEARASFVETRLHAITKRQVDDESTSSDAEKAETLDKKYGLLNYRVTVHTAPDIPSISPATETKIVSGKCLPAFVRLLALNASVFAQVWVNRDSADQGASSWCSRLREINRLRERSGALDLATRPEIQSRGGPSGSSVIWSTSSVPISLGSRDTRDSALFRRTSAANIYAMGSGYPSGTTDGTWDTTRNSGFTSSSNATTDVDGKDRPTSEMSVSKD